MFTKKDKNNIISEKEFQKLIDKVNKIEDTLNLINNQIISNQLQFEETIKTQEEIIVDMINRFNEEFIKFKSRVIADLEEVKSQQDILRISYTINEKQLLEKIKKMIHDDIQKSITGKEHEILMKTWIEELKKIVENFDELKKLHPKEFAIQIEEISTTIEIFKQKLSV